MRRFTRSFIRETELESKPLRHVVDRKQRTLRAARQQQYLEQLAHLGWRKQSLDRSRGAHVVDGVRRAACAEQIEDTAADQERRLRREPGHRTARAVTSIRD